LVNILIEGGKGINVGEAKFKSNYFTLLRNYFYARALGATPASISNLYFSMRALKSLSDQVFLLP
jgi:hypothetical protein